jgi:hypothetical protein
MEVPILETGIEGTEIEQDILVTNVHDTEYGTKVHVQSPYEAKDGLNALDWERTHRRWDETAEMWEVDLDSVAYVILELTDDGYSVAITEDVGKAIEN